MPDRAEEYWASQKENDLRYCAKHKRYYKSDFYCQLCGLETIERSLPGETKVEISACPSCKKASLAWFAALDHFECMNPKCKRVFTKQKFAQIQASKIHKSTDKINPVAAKPADAIPLKPEKDLRKCPICWNKTIIIDSQKGEYECLNCKQRYSIKDYEELIKAHEEAPKGKAWFGNEYWDTNSKKWKKG
jgi:hypothetical protein